MIGGGRIGNPPGTGLPPVVGETAAKEAPAPSKEAAAKPSAKPTDQFEKAEPRSTRGAARPTALGPEFSASTDVLRLARENPAAARQMVAQLSQQTTATLSEIEREMAAARALLEKLANERFSKSARDKIGAEIRRQREKIAAAKLRFAMSSRKAALLQQVAGKLGDPRLDEEIDRMLAHHQKLKTDWGKRHHLLSVGAEIYCDDADTPEHLRQVIAAGVRAGNQGEAVSNTLQEISPHAVIAELIARTIDGTTRDTVPETQAPALRGEYGRPLQTYAMLTDALQQSLTTDPLKKG
ncbi:MAG: hypothetical protein HY903_04125 [Deltaproteobacteria bacterium]|nr:hypothetical protein [Deltaproteobacteria bacterium]